MLLKGESSNILYEPSFSLGAPLSLLHCILSVFFSHNWVQALIASHRACTQLWEKIKKCWKGLFRPAFGVRSTQTLVEIYNSCHICSMRLKVVLVKYEKYGTLSINDKKNTYAGMNSIHSADPYNHLHTWNIKNQCSSLESKVYKVG